MCVGVRKHGLSDIQTSSHIQASHAAQPYQGPLWKSCKAWLPIFSKSGDIPPFFLAQAAPGSDIRASKRTTQDAMTDKCAGIVAQHEKVLDFQKLLPAKTSVEK